MSGINETATVTLNVNGAQAKQMMSELDTKIKATEQTIEELKNKIKDPKALENAQNQLNDYNTRLWAVMDNAARTKTAINEMKASGASPEELEAAKSQLKKYSTEIGHLKRAVKDAKTELDKFEPKTLEKARKELSSYKKQLEGIKSATEGVTQALGSLDTATPRQLEKALRTLNKQLKGLTPGTEVWNSHVEQIQSLKARLAELKDEIDGQQSAWSRFQDWALGAWPAIDLLQQWGGNAFDIMRGAVDAYADMDQEMANVRKFTGMTAEAVDDLNVEFKKIDTRTSRENLNKLAQEAGRLGKTSKDDILGFVKAADKINVALDDLGSDATLKLSKLTGVFGDESRYGTEQSLLKVGSVINELSQNCSASAPYLADFASRMGGVGAQANMTIPQIMAFGAVLDSNGQQVEASSTALSQVIVRMMQEPAKYAKVAGLDVKKFTQMLKTDVN
ncbi:phage tail tape measure protein, partial [uncultured Duncaniella sp.]